MNTAERYGAAFLARRTHGQLMPLPRSFLPMHGK